MKIIHTSDWHLGAQLYDQSRHAEHVKFIAWLKDCLRQEKPDVLIIAGDIFDIYSPSNASLELYYSFLGEVVKEALCGTVIIIGGNHDSPALLNSPDKVLTHLNIKVVGGADIDKEVALIRNAQGEIALAIGAVPYLRDADIRLSGEGESYSEVAAKLRAGLKKYYQDVVTLVRTTAGADVPLVLTGHLYLSKSHLSDDISERTRSIGNIGEVPFDFLPKADYYALGHLHVPQAVDGNNLCRYSGSPLPMSFAEAAQEKSLVIAEFTPETSIRVLPIPCFQKLEQIKGSPDVVERRVRELVESASDIWLDIQIDEYEGALTEFWSSLLALAAESRIKILKRQDMRPLKLLERWGEDAALETLRPEDVFKHRLDAENLTDEEKTQYTKMFDEVIASLALNNVVGDEKE